jgi:16S rRNA (guanine527-N7)-methyltransferase
MSANSEDFAAQLDVSRETLARLQAYVALVEKWQARVNLISPATLPDIWHRHIRDSAQLVPLLSGTAPSIMDIGSGAGFPGLVLAIMTDSPVTLVESDQKKSIFLQTVIRECGVRATVLAQRVEALDPQDVDVITVRALAPVDRLLALLDGQLRAPGRNRPVRCLFLKGQSVHEELACLDDRPDISWQLHPSLTNAHAFVLDLTVQSE